MRLGAACCVVRPPDVTSADLASPCYGTTRLTNNKQKIMSRRANLNAAVPPEGPQSPMTAAATAARGLISAVAGIFGRKRSRSAAAAADAAPGTTTDGNSTAADNPLPTSKRRHTAPAGVNTALVPPRQMAIRAPAAAGAASAMQCGIQQHITSQRQAAASRSTPLSPPAPALARSSAVAAAAGPARSVTSVAALRPKDLIRVQFSCKYTKGDGTESKSWFYHLFDGTVTAVDASACLVSLKDVTVAAGTKGCDDVLVKQHCDVLASKQLKLKRKAGIHANAAGSWQLL